MASHWSGSRLQERRTHTAERKGKAFEREPAPGGRIKHTSLTRLQRIGSELRAMPGLYVALGRRLKNGPAQCP